jgi:hypothetical protein
METHPGPAAGEARKSSRPVISTLLTAPIWYSPDPG